MPAAPADRRDDYAFDCMTRRIAFLEQHVYCPGERACPRCEARFYTDVDEKPWSLSGVKCETCWTTTWQVSERERRIELEAELAAIRDVQEAPDALLRRMLVEAFRAGVSAAGSDADELKRRERLVAKWSPRPVGLDAVKG